MLTLGVPTLNRYGELCALIESAERGTLVPDRYSIIDNGGTFDLSCLVVRHKVDLIQPGKNLGVAASWNKMLRDAPEYLIISNDDAEVFPDTIEKMITFADLNPQAGFLHGKTATDGNAWSFFMHRKWLFDAIGPYDEVFWPAYFEDNDMGYRMLLKGYVPCAVPDCMYSHLGSATLRAFSGSELDRHHDRFRANEGHYRNKWGGLPHNERYQLPFGP